MISSDDTNYTRATVTSDDYLALAKYSEELELYNQLTVQALIASHRRLRDELNSTSRKEWRDSLNEAVSKAEASVLDANWIRVSDLKAMTIEQLLSRLE